MTWQMRCGDCGKNIRELYKPRMVWQEQPPLAEYVCPETGMEHQSVWQSDGATPIRDWLTQWNYPSHLRRW